MSKPKRDPDLPLGNGMMWFAIVWLAGFVVTVLSAMPFHFLGMAAIP